MRAEQALASAGLELPQLPEQLANYLWFKQASDLVWISGQGPRKLDGSFSCSLRRDAVGSLAVSLARARESQDDATFAADTMGHPRAVPVHVARSADPYLEEGTGGG